MAKPKLALIPAAQGDKFYSVLPSDGVGDFDFTRNSSATRIAPTGFIQEVGAFGSELVTNGNFDNDSNWIKVNATISNGVATFVTGTASLQQSISITVGKTYKITYQINSGTGNLYLSSGGFTGVTISIPSTVGTHEVDVTAANTSELYFVSLGSSNLVIDNVSVKEIVGNKSRLNYDLLNGKVVNCPHYLLEPASTNLITYSEDFTDNSWDLLDATIENNSNLATPEGINGVQELRENSDNDDHLIKSSGTFSLSDCSFSLFAKYKGNNRNIKLSLGTGKYASFNLQEGYVFDVQSSAIAKIIKYSNGWYRCEISGNISSSKLNIILLNDTTEVYQGDGASGVYIWGSQIEALSYATSYIPTNGTAITRAAESATDSGNAATFNDSEGVLMAEISALANDGGNRIISLSDGSQVSRVIIYYTSANNQINVISSTNSTNQFNSSFIVSDIKSSSKIAIKYKNNDFSFWVNGIKVGTSTSGLAPIGLSELAFDNGSGGANFYGKTREVQYFDSALTDAQLETLTSWTSLQEMITSQLYTNY